MSQVFFGSFAVGKKCTEERVHTGDSESITYDVPFLDLRETSPNHILTITGLRNFSSNQEAIESGLSEGVVYRNGDQLCIAHERI